MTSVAGHSAFSAVVMSDPVQFISPNAILMNGLFDKNETNNQPSSIEPKGDGDVIADGETSTTIHIYTPSSWILDGRENQGWDVYEMVT